MLVGHHNVMDVVIAHDAGGDVYVVISGNGVNVIGHNVADGRTLIVAFCQVGSGDDADRFVVGVNDGDGADPVSGHDVFDMAQGFMGYSSHHAFLHDVSNFYIHSKWIFS